MDDEELIRENGMEGYDGPGPGRPPSSAGPVPAAAIAAPVRALNWALRSVLKVFVVKVDPNYAQPWQKCPQRSTTGSAFVLDVAKRYILTNSHVVANATTVYVRRPGNPKKWRASVTCLGRQCDLALLRVEEDAFWSVDLRSLRFVDEVPELQSPISVVGYPVGGDSLSITRGIVSRVTLASYARSGKLLSIQIDAAINPGNSGGPAFADMSTGTVAGVAFSKNVSSSTDNIGYIIPRPVVQHFLDEFEAHGWFRGIVSPGFSSQSMENPAQQAYLKLPEGSAAGCTVTKLEPMSEAVSHVELHDVILEIDGVLVAGDETVQFREDERLDYSHVIFMKHIGDQLALKVLRQGKELHVGYTLSGQSPLVGVMHEVDCTPSYFITGGLVFGPLSLPCLEAVYGSRKWRSLAPVSVLNAFTQQRKSAAQQVVILVQVLSHELNHGYRYGIIPLEAFNGAPVHNLAHLAAMVDACRDPYLNFLLEGGRFITLDAAEVRSHARDILRINNIPSDRSEDLQALRAAGLGPQQLGPDGDDAAVGAVLEAAALAGAAAGGGVSGYQA